MTTAPSGGDGGSDSVPSFVETIAELLLPQSGAIAKSIGIASSSATMVLGALAPFAIFSFGAGVGGLVSLVRRRAEDIFLLAAIATVATTSILGVLVQIRYHLGYRLFYFLGALMLVAAAIAVARTPAPRRRTVLTIGVLALFLPYAAVGPVSPLGNNVDPQFGGEDWRFTSGEYEQLESMEQQFDEGSEVKSAVPQLPGQITIFASDGDVYLYKHSCPTGQERIATTGSFVLCQPDR